MLWQKEKPRAEIGPDGMTDYSREMHRQWAMRDAAMAKVHEALAKRLGIESEIIPHLPHEYLTLMVFLGIGCADADEPLKNFQEIK